jgi:hypothetical protein
VAGRINFLYVAESKLCSREKLDYIDRAGASYPAQITYKPTYSLTGIASIVA